MAIEASRISTGQGLPFRRTAIAVILALSIFRLFIAGTLELTNDEAYYWLYSQHLQWNYFDHPPMVAVWIRIFTSNLLFQDTFFLRLGSVFAIAFSSWFMFRAVVLISNERAGLFSVILLQSSFYAGVTAGIYIMPDTPQLFFWTLSLWTLAAIFKDPGKWKYWIFFGLASGFCIMSKVHGAFLWFGLGGYILFCKPVWLRHPALYLALFLTIIIASPILLWNMHYDFITWRFHSNRVSLGGAAWNPKTLFNELASQIGFNNPFNVILIVLGMAWWHRKGSEKKGILLLYQFIGLPLALALIIMSIWRPTLAHWSGPAYISLIPLAAVYLDERYRRIIPAVCNWSLALYVLIFLGWWAVVKFYPGTTGNHQEEHLGSGDLTLDTFGWNEAGKEFAWYYMNEIMSERLSENTPVVCGYWWGAHLEYYFCRPAHAEMIGIGPVSSIHQYAWLNADRMNRVRMNVALCIIPSDEKPLLRRYLNDYQKAELVKTIRTFRMGRPAHNFLVYRLSGWKGRVPVIY